MLSEAVPPSSPFFEFAPPNRSGARAQPDARAWSRAERWSIAFGLVALIALRIAYACIYRIDSDEPQHLHVVWGWTKGLLQYQKLFDNHAPLFQMLCAPFFALFTAIFGERGSIIIAMRLLMLPLFLFDLWCVYKIAARLWSPRAGLWTAALTGFF